MGDLIYLEFRSPHVEDDMMSFLCCSHCRNKTYLLIVDQLDTFPLIKCSACGKHMGRMGWAHDDPASEVENG